MAVWKEILNGSIFRERVSTLIELKGVYVKKECKNILQDISFKINAGENVAILGPNGSGKSSLIKTMIGEYRCDSSCGGWVKIRGNTAWNIFDLRKTFGIVTNELQETFCKNTIVEDVVLSGFFGSMGTNRSQVITECMRQQATQALEHVCALPLRKRPLMHLSSGEIRRVIMARALINHPEALILDEPMNSLDLGGKYLVRQSIIQLACAGHSIIMVTHDPADIGPEFERVIMIKNGTVFLDGSTSVLNSDILSRLYEIPIHVHTISGRKIADY